MASPRVEELPDDFDERINLNRPTSAPQSQSAAAQNALPELPSLEALLSGATPFPSKPADPSQPKPNMPPAMESVKQHTADEVLALMNRTPLFMTSLDETDGEGGENVELEALRALAYEGTRAEIAANFREQGNETARTKRWVDAREYYNKALAALKMPPGPPQDSEEGPADMDVVELDEEDELRKEREIEEAVHVNRALCNLEMKNYGQCNRDCAAALQMNSRNIKAWYRSASACLALDKLPEAEDACGRGLEVDSKNAALQTLSAKIIKRKQILDELQRKRQEREERERKEAATLKLALKSRNIPTRNSEKPPEMEDATVTLEDPLNPASTLSLPVMFLYPVHMKSDFIKTFSEAESVGQHLTYIMPLPWDERHEYTPEKVECYVETAAGGLIKAGKKMSLLRILSTGKVEIVDGMIKVNVLPKDKAAAWIERYKQGRST